MANVSWIRIVCLVVALSSVRAYSAQQQTPELRGVVRDDAGAALVGVSVTLTDEQQQRRVVTTDARGAYLFSNLAPGQYQLTAQLDGFGLLNRKVKVGPSGSSVVNLRMRMAFDQRVDVVGSLAEFRRATGLGAVGSPWGRSSWPCCRTIPT